MENQFIISNENSDDFTFSDYVNRIITIHSLPKVQYGKLNRKGEFWNAVREIDNEINLNSYMMYRNKWYFSYGDGDINEIKGFL